MVSQPDGTPTLGDTVIHHDARGNRSLDDNQSTLANDDRTYLYDARRNVINVRGQYKTAGGWHYYDVSSAFDARNRRVFKQFLDETTLQKAQWFFSYDALDRLTEIRHTPDISSPATYSVFQLFWLGDRLVLYWQTDYPSATTSKRYVGTDESGRPIDLWSWPANGDAARVWAVNPSAWGVDTNLVGPNVFQPILFAGQYQDTETVAWQNDGVTPHRPGVVLNGRRTYDPFTGSYLQPDPKLARTWVSYVYADGNPVGKSDPTGAMASVKVCFSWATERSIGDVDDDGTMDSAIEVIEQCFSQGGGNGGSGGDDTQSGGDGAGTGGGVVGGSWPRPHRHFGTPMELREYANGSETDYTIDGFYCPPVSQLFNGGCWWPNNGDTKQQCQECRQHCVEKEGSPPERYCIFGPPPWVITCISYGGVPATPEDLDKCMTQECALWCELDTLY
jgi:RHS repeat-associated protein